MSAGPDDERARPAAGEGFLDAVTISWGDPRAQLYGLARLALAGGQGSALAVLFAGTEPVAVQAHDGVPLDAGADWAALELAGVATSVRAPLERWTVRFAAPDGRHAFDLELEAASSPATLAADGAVARAGGLEGYEQLCHVRGSATVAGRTYAIACLGQRGHAWGSPDWTRIELTRSLTAWPEGGPGVTLSAIRPAGATNHAEEAVWAALLAPEAVAPVTDPRLSTTYDAAGHQLRAGLELWVTPEADYPHRGAGQVVCGSRLELGSLTLDCAFLHWHVEGRDGVGRYDVLRRA